MDNEILNAVGYKKETINNILNLLEVIPVSKFAEIQAKMQIYETLLKPDYDFEKKQDENTNKENIMKE
ncbi:hypothetical protein KQI61_07930 [Anaerocolumna aminovalerica]|uniref:hypothetical protein n=1 Tax=Anaerocolumna aminovalerica TaxID=1527 RepID=UPI001C0EA7D7|nr:hypothetical protein [Anaerocolumna aminovalerica]MBU5332125.1 hypothetical protein [Anaerocolumna aminovalerica]